MRKCQYLLLILLECLFTPSSYDDYNCIFWEGIFLNILWGLSSNVLSYQKTSENCLLVDVCSGMVNILNKIQEILLSDSSFTHSPFMCASMKMRDNIWIVIRGLQINAKNI